MRFQFLSPNHSRIEPAFSGLNIACVSPVFISRIPPPAARVSSVPSGRLMSGRYGGQEEKKYIHERDIAYLEQCHTAAEYCARKLGWHRIDCMQGATLRSVGEIAQQVWAAVQQVL